MYIIHIHDGNLIPFNLLSPIPFIVCCCFGRHLWKRQRVMHPKGVANITCTNQLQKNNEFTKKNETAEDTIWHATSIAHAGHCTNKSAPKMIIILCEAMSLSLSPPISLLKSVFKSRYMSLCKRTMWLPCHQSLKMMCPSIKIYANSTSGSLGTHSSSCTTGIQPSKNYRGKLKMDSDFVSRLWTSKQPSSVSDFTTHPCRHEHIATFRRNLFQYLILVNQCTHNQYIHI